jgi:hypothetical protein
MARCEKFMVLFAHHIFARVRPNEAHRASGFANLGLTLSLIRRKSLLPIFCGN